MHDFNLMSNLHDIFNVFGDYSFLSCDSKSNYFKQILDSFITNRKYRIKLRLKTNDNKQLIFDDGFEFKVVK